MKTMTLSVVVGMTALMILASYWGDSLSANKFRSLLQSELPLPAPFL